MLRHNLMFGPDRPGPRVHLAKANLQALIYATDGAQSGPKASHPPRRFLKRHPSSLALTGTSLASSQLPWLGRCAQLGQPRT